MELYILQVLIMMQQIGTTWNEITYVRGSIGRKKIKVTTIPDVWIILQTSKKKSRRYIVPAYEYIIYLLHYSAI
jgi:hypothetical protein